MPTLVRLILMIIKLLMKAGQGNQRQSYRSSASTYQRRDVSSGTMAQRQKQQRAETGREPVRRTAPPSTAASAHRAGIPTQGAQQPEAVDLVRQIADQTEARAKRRQTRVVEDGSQEARVRRDKRVRTLTPQQNAVIDRLLNRIKQEDQAAYFELLELYSDKAYRRCMQDVITGEIENFWQGIDWNVLQQDPARYVRLSLMGMVIRGDSPDSRDDVAAIEHAARFAKEHTIDPVPILNEIVALPGSMADEIRRRRYLFED